MLGASVCDYPKRHGSKLTQTANICPACVSACRGPPEPHDLAITNTAYRPKHAVACFIHVNSCDSLIRRTSLSMMIYLRYTPPFRKIPFKKTKEHEECGVVRLLGVKDAGALGALASCPDRGQETAGIAATHIFPRARGRSQPRRNPHPAGAFGHSCNFTAGASNTAHAQPLPVWYSSGLITLAHNCNLSNGKELTETLLHGGPVLQTTTDSELFLHLFAQVE